MTANVRIQVRLSWDSRAGAVWQWLGSLPEAERKPQLMYLVQLGFDVRRGLRQEIPASALAGELSSSVEPVNGRDPHKLRAASAPLDTSMLDEWDVAELVGVRQP